MKDKNHATRPPTGSGRRDGWAWEPPMRLPTRRRLKDLAYDDRKPLRKAS